MTLPPRPAATATVLAVMLAAPVLADDVSLDLVNQSGLTVMEFYTSPADVAVWGEDLLGAGVIGPGESGTVVIADEGDVCAFDLRFVFDDGQERIDSADVCEAASFTLAP